MKIQVGVNITPLSGYTNVDPMGGENKVALAFTNLDPIAEKAECWQILGEQVMDYIPSQQVVPVLQHWVSKLRHKGRLIVGGTDINEIAKGILSKRLSTVDANLLLHGTCQHAWDVKYGQMTLSDLVGLLESVGLKIVKKRTNSIYMVVEAERE